MSVRLNGGVIELDLTTSFDIDTLTEAFTIALWVKKVGNFTDYDPPVSFGENTNSRGGSVEIQSNGTPGATTTNGSNFDGSGNGDNLGTMTAGTWRYVSFAHGGLFDNAFYTGTAGALTEYTGYTWGPTGLFRYLRIGDLKQTGLVTALNGEVAHMRIWAARLTEAQLETESNSTTPVITSGLRYSCQLADTTTKTDQSGNSLVWSSSGTIANGSSEPLAGGGGSLIMPLTLLQRRFRQ